MNFADCLARNKKTTVTQRMPLEKLSTQIGDTVHFLKIVQFTQPITSAAAAPPPQASTSRVTETPR